MSDPQHKSEPNPISLSSDFSQILSELDFISPHDITIPSFGFNITFPSDRRSVIYNTQNGIATCNKSSLEVVKSLKLIEGTATAFCYSEHTSKFYLGDRKGILHIFDAHKFKEERSLELHSKSISKLILSFDELLLYSASSDSEVSMTDLCTFLPKVLYSHDGEVIKCMDISSDGEYIVSAGVKQLKIFSIMEEKVVHSLDIEDSTINSVKFSPDGDTIAFGDNLGALILIKRPTWTQSSIAAAHLGETSHVLFTSNSIISAGSDKSVKIWHPNITCNPLLLTTKSNITDIAVDEDFLYIFSANLLSLIKLPTLPTEILLKNHSRPIQNVLYNSKLKLFFTSAASEKKVGVWSSEDFKLIKELETEAAVICMCLSADQLGLYASLASKVVRRWALKDFSSDVAVVAEFNASSIKCTADGFYLLTIDSSCRLIVRDLLNGAVIWSFSNHKLSGMLVATTALSGMAVSVGGDKVMFVYDLIQGKYVGKVEGIETEASRLKISVDDRLVAVSTITNVTYLVSIEKLAIIHVFHIEKEKCADVYFTQDNKFFIILGFDYNGSLLEFYTLADFCRVASIATEAQCLCFSLINEEKFIVFGEDENLYIRENPLKAERFQVVGPDSEYPIEYFRYLINIAKGAHSGYRPEMDRFVILPSLINSLHFYANYNLGEYMEKALENGGSGYVANNGMDIMKISLEKGYTDNVRIILRHLVKSFNVNDHCACFLSNSLIRLSSESCIELEEFYNYLLIKPKDKSLPRFATRASGVFKSRFFEIHPNDMVAESGQGQPIVFYQSALDIDTELGSNDSISYLQSILSTGNSEIFRSKFIEILLSHKWNQVKWFIELFSIFYLSNLLVLSLYILDPNEYYFIALAAQNTILILFEIYEILLTNVSYFSNLWNAIDFLRFVLFIVYFSLKEFYPGVMFALVLLSWTRGIAHFRVFRHTRYLIHLLIEVSRDIFAFMTVLVYFTLAFTFMLISIKPVPAGYSNLLLIEKIFLMNFGDFDINDNSNGWDWTLFVISSIINFLVMINLLISIIGDTYDKVHACRDIADRKQMAEMVLEIENLMIWKREKGFRRFLHLTECETEDGEGDTWQGRVRELQNRISRSEKGIRVEIARVENKIDGVRGDLAGIKEILEKISSAKSN